MVPRDFGQLINVCLRVDALSRSRSGILDSTAPFVGHAAMDEVE